MFIYTENDTESDKRIKNNNFEYKTHQQYTNTFPKIQFKKKLQKYFYYKSNFHNSYFIYFVYFVYFVYCC